MENTTVAFLSIDIAIILILVIAKTITFFRSARKRSIGRWFYFDQYDIFNAPSEKVKTARLRQNRLSLLILFLVLLSPVAYFVIFSFF